MKKPKTAEILQGYRREHNVLLLDMARELSISSAELSAYENEKKAMPNELIDKIKIIYGIDLKEKSNNKLNIPEAIEKLLTQFENDQAAQITYFKTAIEIIKAQEAKIQEITRERDAAIKDIESLILNVNNNISCRYCKYYSDISNCKVLMNEKCEPKCDNGMPRACAEECGYTTCIGAFKEDAEHNIEVCLKCWNKPLIT